MQRLTAALALSLLLSGVAHAEIFKCIGPNGDLRFTSSSAQCPNAPPHAPKEAAVQRIDKPRPLATARPGAVPAQSRTSAAALDENAGAEALWRKKKADAQQQAHDVEARIRDLQRAVRWCNDGDLLWVEDDRTGIRQEVPCSQIDAMKLEFDAEKERVEQYLAEGLEEECRRAGCLPGWLR